MVSAGRDRRRRASGAEVDRGEVVTELSWAVAAVGGVALAELPRDVGSPALHRVVVEERTRVSDAGGDRDCRTSGAEVDGWQVVTHRADLETARDGVALAELSVVVASPALHRPVRQPGAGVLWPGCDHGGGPTRGPGHAAAGDRRRGRLRDRHEDGRHRRDAGCQLEDQLRGPVTVHVDSSGGELMSPVLRSSARRSRGFRLSRPRGSTTTRCCGAGSGVLVMGPPEPSRSAIRRARAPGSPHLRPAHAGSRGRRPRTRSSIRWR